MSELDYFIRISKVEKGMITQRIDIYQIDDKPSINELYFSKSYIFKAVIKLDHILSLIGFKDEKFLPIADKIHTNLMWAMDTVKEDTDLSKFEVVLLDVPNAGEVYLSIHKNEEFTDRIDSRTLEENGNKVEVPKNIMIFKSFKTILEEVRLCKD